MSILHVESLENGGDDGLLGKTDHSAIFIAVVLNAEELLCSTDVGDLVFLREVPLNLDRGLDGRLCIHIYHGGVIDVQMHEDAVAADREVRIGFKVCESEEEEDGVDIVVPKPRCSLETVDGYAESHNHQWCMCIGDRLGLKPTIAEHHIDIIVNNLMVEK